MRAKFILVGLLIAVFFVLTLVSGAADYKRGADDNPVLILSYVAHPIGMAAEYLVARPIHWITKQVNLNKIFGSKNTTEDKSFVWE